MTKVVNRRNEAYDIYIGRPTQWGNPFSHLDDTSADYIVSDRDTAVRLFREYAVARLAGENDWLEPLRGKTLGCWCKPLACHGDVIVELLDKG